jgi:hypothetical protein
MIAATSRRLTFWGARSSGRFIRERIATVNLGSASASPDKPVFTPLLLSIFIDRRPD